MSSTPTRYKEFPLRARKRAATRVALVRALLPRLAEQPLDGVPISALCDDVEISQATFFNYFTTKADLLTHFIQLWSLKVGLIGRRLAAKHADPLKAVEALFAYTAEDVAPYPRVMTEIIAHQARRPPCFEIQPIELVERLLFLDDDPASGELSDKGLGELLPVWLTAAVERGILPEETSIPELTLAISSVFFGVPLLLVSTQPKQIGAMYQRQLQLIWAGAGASRP